MSEPQQGYQRVMMVRHEYVSDGWASVHRGRLLSGNVYDIPEKDANGKEVAQKWLDMGIAVKSNRNMTTRDEELERRGEYDPYATAAAATSVRRLAADGPVQQGMTETQVMHPGPTLPPGGLAELTAEQATAIDAGRPVQEQGSQAPGAFSAEQLSQPAHDDDDKVVFNRNQLRALADAGYVSQDDMDKASDDDLMKVDGVGESSVRKYRAQRDADRQAEQRARSGPIEGR